MLKSSYNLRPRPRALTVSSCQRRKRCRRPSIPYLPPGIIFAVLVYLPADILYNVARYVCQEWYNIISSLEFIDAHLLKMEYGLLIKLHYGCRIQYVEMEKNDILQKVTIASSPKQPHYGISCCNGLAYLCHNDIRQVVNFVTKEALTLSPPSESMSNNDFHSMGYTRSKKYKLVEFYTIRDTNHMVAAIRTLGVDKEWRSLFRLDDGTEIENFGSIDFISGKPIVSAQGILHVIHRNLPLVFNLDLETENFYTRAIPECSKIYRTYMGTGRSLCVMDYLGNFSWELWLLKDAEGGEWAKQAVVDLGDEEKSLRDRFIPYGFVLKPVGFLKDGEIAVFNVTHPKGWRPGLQSRYCVTYNVNTGCINYFVLEWCATFDLWNTWMYNPLVKSLVSPKLGEN